jgi:P4 family phage/plasmid primase-like protien
MPTNNMSPEGEAVKSPTPGAPSLRSRMVGKRPRRPAKSADEVVKAKAAVVGQGSTVGNLAEARMAKDEELEKLWLTTHRTDARTGQLKPPSLDFIFARHMVSGKTGNWACQASDATGAVIHKWTGTYWKAINTEVGEIVASDWLERHAPHAALQGKSEQCWAYATGRLRRHKQLPALDAKRAIVPCADAYIEVLPAGFQVLAPDPAFGMTHAIKINTGGKLNRPYFTQVLPKESLFAKFLERAQPDPAVRALLQEQCGMTLLPGNYSQAAWWYGAAGSGKSTLAELVEAMHRQSVRLNLETLGDRFSLEPLVGASLILVDEVECEKWAEGRFKTLVSGNGIGIDRKNEKALASYHSRAKWLITSNSAPFVRDKSNGVWRRLVVVYWGAEVPEDERQTDFHKILLEKEGKLILDWMLEGARRIIARGRAMSERELPEAALRAKQHARNNSDSVRAWATEMRVVRKPDHWMPLKEVYKLYSNWCATQGYTESDKLTSKQFWRGMSEAGLTKPDRKVNRRLPGPDGGTVQTELYELEILGSYGELANQWACAQHVSTATKNVLTAEEIYSNYKAWADKQVEDKALSEGNLLEAKEWMVALDAAGYINKYTMVEREVDGVNIECFRMRIGGEQSLGDEVEEGETE